MSSDNKKVINRVNIDPFGHAWAVKMANKYGVSMADFCGMALASLATAWKPDTDEIASADEFQPEYIRLYIDYFEEQQRHRRRQLVREVAIIHTQYPDDASADRLARMCKVAGMDLTEIMDAAKSTEFGSIVDYSRDGTKFGQCLQWLASYISKESKNGNGVPSMQIYAAGKASGFEQEMIKRAKGRICHDPLSPMIRSKKGPGGTWIWHIEAQEASK